MPRSTPATRRGRVTGSCVVAPPEATQSVEGPILESIVVSVADEGPGGHRDPGHDERNPQGCIFDAHRGQSSGFRRRGTFVASLNRSLNPAMPVVSLPRRLLEVDDQQHENHADRRRCGENAASQQPAQSHCRRGDGRPNPSSRKPLQSRILTAGPGHDQVFQPPVDGGADPSRHLREGSRRLPSWRIMKRPAHGRALGDRLEPPCESASRRTRAVGRLASVTARRRSLQANGVGRGASVSLRPAPSGR